MDDSCDVRFSEEDARQLEAIVKTVLVTEADDHNLFFRFSQIVVRYQEQPQLLDPVIESLITPLAALLLESIPEHHSPEKSTPSTTSFSNRIFVISKFLWQLASVRGYKTVIRFLPNEVAAFEPVVRLLQLLTSPEQEQRRPEGFWEAQYVALMWMSMLAMVPFDLIIIDSQLTSSSFGTFQKQQEGSSSCPPIVTTMMDICKKQLSNPAAGREMAAVVLGRLLTRPDMNAELLKFLKWAFEALETTEGFHATFLLPGVTLALAVILKLGQKDVLINSSSSIAEAGINLLHSKSAGSNALLRKLAVKLVQRATLITLPVQLASWRYKRTRRTLGASTTDINTNQKHHTSNNIESNNEELRLDEDVASTTEAALGELLSVLGDRDTVVRWSAAKGIARIVERLPRSMGDEVVGAVLESLDSVAAGDAVWHGGCLALAELIRRGLLMPERLEVTVPVVLKALEYDVRRGPCSIGSHVRDAGAYVCWAIARAYSIDDLGVTVHQLAPALICLACYDRDVNCRRAAAAAFQECVGRLGAFPHGIDIVTAADYFTVSVRHNAYVTVAPVVAGYPGYLDRFTWHLLRSKLNHWEKATRELAAEALAALVHLQPEVFVKDVLGYLLEHCCSVSIEMRHGAVCTLAELLPALRKCEVAIPKESTEAIAEVIPSIHSRHFSKGKGGEIMRSALCRFCETISTCHIHLNESQKESVFKTIMDNLEHSSPDIQIAAGKALSAYTDEYLSVSKQHSDSSINNTAAAEECDTMVLSGGKNLIDTLLSILSTASVPTARRGAALAIGYLPSWCLKDRENSWKVLKAFTAVLDIVGSQTRNNSQSASHYDPETKTNAALSIAHVVECSFTEPVETTHGANSSTQDVDDFKLYVLEPLIGALNDYHTDNRGDVGSWVREASMKSLSQIYTHLYTVNNSTIPESFIDCAVRALHGMVKQSVERIGKVRECGARNVLVLAPLLLSTSSSSSSSTLENNNTRSNTDAQDIYSVYSQCTLESFSGTKALASIAQLLRIKALRPCLLEGFAFSIGGLDAQLSEAASDAIADSVNLLEENEDDIIDIGEVLLHVWAKHARSSRLCTPFLLLADVLMSRAPLGELGPPTSDFPIRLLRLIKGEVVGCTDVPRLKAAASVVCQLVGCGEEAWREEAVVAAIGLIGNKYPKVRRYAAEQLYTAMISCDPEELPTWDVESAMALLEETAWDGPGEVVRPVRFKLLQAFGQAVDIEVVEAVKGESAGVEKRADENDSYRSLLDRQMRGF